MIAVGIDVSKSKSTVAILQTQISQNKVHNDLNK